MYWISTDKINICLYLYKKKTLTYNNWYLKKIQELKKDRIALLNDFKGINFTVG